MKSPIKIQRKNSDTSVVSNRSANNISPNNVAPNTATAFPVPPPPPVMPDSSETVDLERRRAQLSAKVAELQWDLGGLVYEMATRNRLRPDVLVKRAGALQEVDAELGEIERILRMDRTGVAALCLTCGAPHSAGAVYCWQCGGSLLEKVASASIAASRQ